MAVFFGRREWFLSSVVSKAIGQRVSHFGCLCLWSHVGYVCGEAYNPVAVTRRGAYYVCRLRFIVVEVGIRRSGRSIRVEGLCIYVELGLFVRGLYGAVGVQRVVSRRVVGLLSLLTILPLPSLCP